MLTLNRFLIGAFLSACASNALAQQTTCTVSPTNFSLGVYPSYNTTPVDSQGPIIVTCVRSGGPGVISVTVAMGPSANSNSIASRQLKLTTGSDLLSYNLYRDVPGGLVWGNTAPIDTLTQSINLSNRASGTLTFTIFGRIAALQDVRAGSYADSVDVTVTP